MPGDERPTDPRRGSVGASPDAGLARTFSPRTVAVVGASRTPGRIGSAILANLVAAGYTGRLVAVNPHATAVDGVPAVAAVDAIDGPVDLAVIAVPAAQVPAVVESCIAKGVGGLVLITAGFRETGAAGAAAEAALVERVRQAGVRMIGPNCMGIVNTDPAVRLNATFAPSFPPRGPVAFLTQSGALGLAILQYASKIRLGISTFASVGNAADVSNNDLLRYWADDPGTSVILLYLENVGNPRTFARLAAALTPRKPIVLVKAGRSRAGARAAQSHTGALASADGVVDAMCRQTGVIRVESLEELFGVATLLVHQPVPRGRRVAVLTNAGGPGIMAADAIEAEGLAMAILADTTVAALRALCPPEAAVGNPVDLLAAAPPDRYAAALAFLLDDPGVDSVLVVYTPPLVTKAHEVVAAVRAAAMGHTGGKAVVANLLDVDGVSAAFDPVPVFAFPEAAVAALARASAYGAWRARPRTPPVCPAGCDVETARRRLQPALSRGGDWLTADEVQEVLAALEVPLVPTRTATAETVERVARAVGYPVVLKAVGADLVHKTEAGGVVLDVRSPGELQAACADLTARLGDRLSGLLVQPYLPGRVELLIGGTVDRSYGPLVTCGLGGTKVEVLRDVGLRMAPVSPADVDELLTELRGAALLDGYRGAAPVDRRAVVDAVCRISWLMAACPEVAELDLNPVVADAAGIVVLDARIRVAEPAGRPPRRRAASL